MPKAFPPIVEVITEGIRAMLVISRQALNFNIGKTQYIGHDILRGTGNKEKDKDQQMQALAVAEKLHGKDLFPRVKAIHYFDTKIPSKQKDDRRADQSTDNT